MRVSLGAGYACALTAAGAVKCWGWNKFGELGNDSIVDSHVPVDVVGTSPGGLAVSAAYIHTCAVLSSGAVKCWGINTYGALGDGSTVESHVPVDVVGLSSGVLGVSCGHADTCAVTSAGAIKCWGAGGDGELGNDPKMDSHVPVDVLGF